MSRKRAEDHIALVRETARRRTRDFVRTWMAGVFSDAGEYQVQVVFQDESPEVTIGAPPG